MITGEECILIHDAFPKAAHHALVLPVDTSLHDMHSLNRAHIPLLTHMKVGDPVVPLLYPSVQTWLTSKQALTGEAP